MTPNLASLPGADDAPNEDFAAFQDGTVVVLDGLTARTESGCVHGVPWFVRQLAAAVLRHAHSGPADALRRAITETAARHGATCDLQHPGTPSAMVAIVQEAGDRLRYLVLGDATVLLDRPAGIDVVTDGRVQGTAAAERAAADALPLGSPEKRRALVRMKHAEIAARNVPGGYWVANTDPAAVDHALTGDVSRTDLRAVAVLTDGAARLAEDFAATNWRGLLDLLRDAGPAALLARVRELEDADADAERWPRNKKSDDATAVYWPLKAESYTV